MTDSRSTLDDEVDDEPVPDSRETCGFWNSRASKCGREEKRWETCADCPDADDSDERLTWAQERETGVNPFPHDAPYPGPGNPCPHGGGAYSPAFRCAACTAEDRVRAGETQA